MHITYDSRADAVYVDFTETRRAGRISTIETDTPRECLAMVNTDWRDGVLVGVEIIGARATLPAELIAAAEDITGPGIPFHLDPPHIRE